MKNVYPWLALLALLSVHGPGLTEPATLDESLKAIESVHGEGEASQKRIAALQAQTQSLVAEYKRLSQGSAYQEEYQAEMRERLAEQDRQILSLREQLTGSDLTAQRILPLMRNMAETLEQFVVLDMPFHQEERLARAIKVRQQVASTTMNLPDKYRALLSAYQQELEYGRSLEAWRGELTLTIDGKQEALTVEFLRVGRIGYFFQTMDGSRSGSWDKVTKSWVLLPRRYNHDIKQGLRMAWNQQAPQMLVLPFTKTSTPSSARTGAQP